LKHISSSDLSKIEDDGVADVHIGERTFKISRQFVDDVRRKLLAHDVASLRKPLLIMHAPCDETVGIENATEIFLAGKHPKSFISLDAADHLLSDPEDAAFAGQVIAGWLSRYVPADTPQEDDVRGDVRVMETGEGRFQNMVRAGRHRVDCAADGSPNAKIDRFTRNIAVGAEVTDELRAKIIEIANKCPVHRTLKSSSVMATSVDTLKEPPLAERPVRIQEFTGDKSG
jgi:hypothetical protein